MNYREFADELGIAGKVLSIKRTNAGHVNCPGNERCTFLVLNRAFQGETVRLTAETVGCFGGKSGFGFVDGLMKVPGGYGNFISSGAGEGFPTGMRLKCTPQLAEHSALAAPQEVMEGFSVIEIKGYEDSDDPDLVTILSNPDQLSALNLLFHYSRQESDHTFFPNGSGCSSVFRLPFAELRSENPRAVIGNADISSRPGFAADTLFFTVSGEAFRQMLSDADESFITLPTWKKLKDRL